MSTSAIQPTMADLRRWLNGQQAPAEQIGEGSPHGAESLREIEFAAYTEDCRLFGFVHTTADRLSDALNMAERVTIRSALVVALEDSRAVEVRELVVERAELVAVRASGPRGNVARRTRTRPSPVAMRAGPYSIHGYLHPPPGGDPLQQFRRRATMVPLTEAWIAYESGGSEHRARVGPLIVNRDFVDWIDNAKDADVRLDLPVEIRIDPLAKDMTGHVRLSG